MWPFSGGGVGAQNGVRESAGKVMGPPRSVDLTDETAAQERCPVDHETRATWLRQSRSKDDNASDTPASSSALAFLSSTDSKHRASSSGRQMTTQLSSERVVSSIPRLGKASGESNDVKDQSADKAIADPTTSRNWVYPSPAQFFAAMERKNHNPQAQDMNIVVPIHNAVNERAWQQILEWEKVADSGSWSACGGPQLVSFKGRPKDLTWKAWAYGVLGYQKPFDRHDWEIDRCGQRIKYVIDFYTGRTTKSDARTSLSFYLDVRPSPASVEGIRMRIARFFTRPAVQPQHSSA